MKTISIIIPAVKINLDITNLKFDTLEKMVFDITQQIGRVVLEKALVDIDDRLRVSRPRKLLENTGKRAKYLLTRLGDIRYSRTRYRDTATGKSRYLLEEHLGLARNQRLSLMRAKIEMFIASITPYRGAIENIEQITGYSRSHESLRQSVIKEAERIVAHQKSSIAQMEQLKVKDEELPAPPDTAYMETDATYLRRQRSRKRKGKYRTRRRRGKSMEVKLGVGYSGKEARYESGRQLDKRLKDKFVYLSLDRGNEFMEDLSIIAERKMSLSGAKEILFGGDGDRWIRNGIRDFFPGAKFLLCDFHLARNTKRGLAYRKESQTTIIRLLMSDEIDKALGIIRRMMNYPRDRKEKKALRDLYSYISENRAGINAVKRIKNREVYKRVRGTGAVEPNIDKIVTHRFKKRGMSWSVKGALGLLKIKELIVNSEWDGWWSGRRDHKIEIDPEPLQQLSSKNLWKVGRRMEPLIEASIPALTGPDHDEPWAKVLRELQKIEYYKIG